MDTARIDFEAEWLEADGLGGFASGTVGGRRTRRYHALLLTATTPPTGRVVLVNGIEAWVEVAGQRCWLSSQKYLPEVCFPDEPRRILRFTHLPWPIWTFRLDDGSTVEQEIVVDREACETVLRWRRRDAAQPARLLVRPLLSGRDYHLLQRENAGFDFGSRIRGGNVSWRPYPGMTAVSALSNGRYEAAPEWYRNFTYDAEAERGLDHVEDLASPGVFSWNLEPDRSSVLVLRSGDGLAVRARTHAGRLVESERARRRKAASPLALAAEAYRVDRGGGRTILAGFPWFCDWGRDTFISLRGLAISTGRLDDAERILSQWAGTVSEGMMPNRFPDQGEGAEYNSVDASLWYIVAVHDFFAAATAAAWPVADATAARLREAADEILAGYVHGTRYGIAVGEDGLVKAGVPGLQLTWMDARVGDRVITPRIGKPVEIQALWINALRISAAWTDRWAALEKKALQSFLTRFPNPSNGGLFDVVDADHEAGRNDGSVRPNQILAVGGLPFAVLEGTAARGVVDLVERTLLTPLGLRTLSPEDPAYQPHFSGGMAERDAAYHQGSVWPWLMGPFVEAWLRVRGNSTEAKAEADLEFLTPLRAHLETAGLGHVSEVADGDAPHKPGGCPFQAWSLAELIRADALVRAKAPAAGGAKR